MLDSRFPFLILLSVFLIPIIGMIDFLISIGIIDGTPGRSRPDHLFPDSTVLKELLALAIFIYTLVFAYCKGSITELAFFLILLTVFLMINTPSFESLVAGARQSIGFVYIVVSAYIVRGVHKGQSYSNFIPRMVSALQVVLVIEFLMVLLQLKYMPAVEGLTFFGPRVVGSFTNPNTIGVFSVVLLLTLHLLSDFKKSGKAFYLIPLFIVIASGSRLAVVLLFAVYSYIVFVSLKDARSKMIMLLLASTVLAYILLNINFLASKPEGVKLFYGVRVINFLDYIDSANIFQLLFGSGWGTNTSWHRVLIGEQKALLPPMDSFVAVILYQVGIIGSLFFYLAFAALFSALGIRGWFLYFVFVLIGLQVNILEFYPVNFLIFIVLGILLGVKGTRFKVCFLSKGG